MQLADRLLGQMKGGKDEIREAMKEAKGFNMIGSKSTKTIAMNGTK